MALRMQDSAGGEHKMAETGLWSPKAAQNLGVFVASNRNAKSLARLQSEHKCHAAKTFCYFAVHDTFVDTAGEFVGATRRGENRNALTSLSCLYFGPPTDHENSPA